MNYRSIPIRSEKRRLSVIGNQPITDYLSPITISMYDIAGRVVQTLVDEKLKAGYYSARFDGRGLASGVYFARLTAGDYKAVRKMILLR